MARLNWLDRVYQAFTGASDNAIYYDLVDKMGAVFPAGSPPYKLVPRNTLLQIGTPHTAANDNLLLQAADLSNFQSSVSLPYEGLFMRAYDSTYGGDILIAAPVGSSIGTVRIDVVNDRLRIWHTVGSLKGTYIDLTNAAGNANSRIYHSGDKPTPSELGVAAAYLGTVTSGQSVLSFAAAQTVSGMFVINSGATDNPNNTWNIGIVVVPGGQSSGNNGVIVITQSGEVFSAKQVNGTWTSWVRPYSTVNLPLNRYGWKYFAGYTTPGTYGLTAPDPFNGASYEMGVYMVGGGGSGAVSIGNNLGASGGAAGYAKNVIVTVNPGQALTVVVGAGGVAVSGGYLAGNAGGSSGFTGNTVSGGEGGKLGSYGCPGASGGQGSDGTVNSRFLHSSSKCGGVPTNGSDTNPGGFSQAPKQCQNAFDQTSIDLAAGGGAMFNGTGSSQIGAIVNGGSGGDGATSNTSGITLAARGGSGFGNGGGGCAIYSGTATSGAGANGGVFIYYRMAVQ